MNKLAEISENLKMHPPISHDTALANMFPARLKLRLDQGEYIPGRLNNLGDDR